MSDRQALQRVNTDLKRMEDQFGHALAGRLDPVYFRRTLMTLVRTTPKLLECDRASLLGAFVHSAQVGLIPGPPHGLCWVIPRKITGQMRAQWQMGYKGACQLAYRSAKVKAIRAGVVCENDHFLWQDGLEPKLEHTPALEDRGEKIAVWAVVDTVDGGRIPAVLTRSDIETIMKMSDAARNKVGPWVQEGPDEWMWKKSAVLRALKLAPVETEIQAAIGAQEQADYGITQDLPAVDLGEASSVEVEEDEEPGGQPDPMDRSFSDAVLEKAEKRKTHGNKAFSDMPDKRLKALLKSREEVVAAAAWLELSAREEEAKSGGDDPPQDDIEFD